MTGQSSTNMLAEDFVALVASPKMFGNPLLRTQHLVGASKWEKATDNEIFAYHQIRSGSVQLVDTESKVESAEKFRRVIIKHTYSKIYGHWKLAGLKPMSR